MTSLDDLDFMPFESRQDADGAIEVAVDDKTSLFLRSDDRRQEDAPLHATVIVSAVGARSTAVL